MKMADESKVKLDGCGSKDEVLSLRAEVGKLGAGVEAMKKQIEGLRASGTIVTPNALMSMPFTPAATQQGNSSSGPAQQGADGTSVEALRAQKEEIKALLSMLEDEYREGVISEKTFAEARMKNESHLKELEHMIDEKQSGKQQGRSPPPTKEEEEHDKEEKIKEPHQATKPEPPKENTSPPQKQQQPHTPAQPADESKNNATTSSSEEKNIEHSAAQQEENKSSHSSESTQQQHQLIVDESLSDLEEILSLINNTGKISKQKRDLEKMLETVKKQHAKGLVSDDSYYNIVKSTN